MTSKAKMSLVVIAAVAMAMSSGCGKMAEHQAKQWVAGMMKDPDSAQFDAVKTIGEGRDMLACGKVNAKNSYGGYSGFKSFMLYERNVYVANDEMQDLSIRMCCNWLYDAGKAGAKAVSVEEHKKMCGDIGYGNFLPID